MRGLLASFCARTSPISCTWSFEAAKTRRQFTLGIQIRRQLRAILMKMPSMNKHRCQWKSFQRFLNCRPQAPSFCSTTSRIWSYRGLTSIVPVSTLATTPRILFRMIHNNDNRAISNKISNGRTSNRVSRDSKFAYMCFDFQLTCSSRWPSTFSSLIFSLGAALLQCHLRSTFWLLLDLLYRQVGCSFWAMSWDASSCPCKDPSRTSNKSQTVRMWECCSEW